MGSEDARFLEVANAPEFEQAWQAIVDEPVTYDEFCALPMPPKVSHDELWGVFSLLKRCTGRREHTKPWFKGVEKDSCWSYTPKSTERDYFELSTLVSRESSLNARIEAQGTPSDVFSDNLVEEVASLARRDGLPLSERDVRSIWIHRTPPRNGYEQVIESTYHLFNYATTLVDRPFTRFLADDVHTALTHGLDKEPLQRRLHFDPSYYRMDLLDDPAFVDEAFHVCLDNINGARTFQDAIHATIVMADTLWDLSVWPELNALTEFVLRRISLVKKGIPALSYVCLSSRDDLGATGLKRMHEQESSSTPSLGLDSTWLYAGQVRILLEGAKELLKQIEALEQDDVAAQHKIQSAPWLNARQKSLLLTLRKDPRRTVKIRDHAQAHNVAYATARQDLLELEQHGVLIKEQKSKTFVYRLSSRIEW